MNRIVIYFSLLIFLFLFSCEEIEDIVDDTLTNEEIVEGLKTALELGTDSSTTVLSAVDGYYGDELVKILLPPEAEPMLEYVDIIEQGAAVFALIGVYEPAGEGFVENTIKSINRSAENAANEAKPIFVSAITGMTISDGLDILQGQVPDKAEFDSTAATTYLYNKTFNSLSDLYSPKIDAALDIVVLDFGGNTSYTTNELWYQLIKYFNDAVTICKLGVSLGLIQSETQLGELAGETQIDENMSLGEYATEKALDGLFYKVGEEEKKIRKNPYEWALDIIHRVFGYVYEES